MKRLELLDGIRLWNNQFELLSEKERKRIFRNQTKFLILKEPNLICEPLSEILKELKRHSLPSATDSRLENLGFSILKPEDDGYDIWYPILAQKLKEIDTGHSDRDDPRWNPITLYVETTGIPKKASYRDVLGAMEHIGSNGIPNGFGDSVYYEVIAPRTGNRLPVKAVWGLATSQNAYDFNAVQAKESLRRLGFQVLDLREVETVLDIFDETSASQGTDGSMKQVTTNRYERNPTLRRACAKYFIDRDGRLACQVCDMDFKSRYGDIGCGFIHIHHLDPLGDGQGERKVDPTQDLVPVCPNCHAMLHKKPGKSNVYTLEELRKMLIVTK